MWNTNLTLKSFLEAMSSVGYKVSFPSYSGVPNKSTAHLLIQEFFLLPTHPY